MPPLATPGRPSSREAAALPAAFPGALQGGRWEHRWEYAAAFSSSHCALDPQPRHSGGMGRRPLDTVGNLCLAWGRKARVLAVRARGRWLSVLEPCWCEGFGTTYKNLQSIAKINEYCISGPSWGSFWGSFGPSWGPLGPSRDPLGPSWRAWAVLGPSGGPLGNLLWPPVALLGLSWEPFGTLWDPSWAVLGLSWTVLEPFWAVLERSSGPLRPSWGGLGSLLGRLGRY